MSFHHSIPAAVLAVMATWNVVKAESAEAWLAARHGYLTASDVAAVLGLHPHKSRAAVLKAKRAAPDLEPRVVKAMRAGHFLEPAVLAWFLDDQGALAESLGEARPEGAQCRNEAGTSVLVAHPDASLRLAASPDGLLVGGASPPLCVEVKVHGPRQWALWDVEPQHSRLAAAMKFKARWTDANEYGYPVQHWTQLQVQMLCCGATGGWLVGNCGSERREHFCAADEAFHERVVEETRKFWDEVGV